MHESVTRKVSWFLMIALCLGVAGVSSAQAGPPAHADSLFNKIKLDTLPAFGPDMQTRWNAIENKPYNKAIQPVQVKNAVRHLLQDSSITLTIPRRSRVEFIQEKITWHDSSNYRWSGQTSDGSFKLNLVVHGDRITGTMIDDTASYRIQPLGDLIGVQKVNNIHVITEVDPDEVTLIDPVKQKNTQKTRYKTRDGFEQLKEEIQAAEGETDQGIMVIYTDNVANEVNDPEGLIESAISDANNAYENSGIPLELTLVHTREMDYPESGNTDTDLTRLQDSTDEIIDEVHDYRDQYGADIVVMLTSQTQSDQAGTVTGEAYEIMADTSTAFAVLRYDFAEAPFYTLAHEVGHLQGADHNPADEINPYKSYGHGFTYPDGGWRTIMAYNQNGCCSRIEFFSTPDVTYQGDPLGTSSESDNARLLGETADIIAGFRPPFPLEVLISGPSFVRSGESGTWVADVSGGTKPYSHTWYRRSSGDQYWSQVEQGDTLTLVVENQFQIKLETTDEIGETKSSSVFDVYTGIKNDLKQPDEKPSEFKLHNNYPNPFNPSTRVSYYLPEAANVNIEVYTVNGQKITTLVNRLEGAGNHQLTFNAEDLPSGLYMLKMSAEAKGSNETFYQTIKMTLLK